jgi:hypothetical protein
MEIYNRDEFGAVHSEDVGVLAGIKSIEDNEGESMADAVDTKYGTKLLLMGGCRRCP